MLSDDPFYNPRVKAAFVTCTRALSLAVLVLTFVWVFGYLGGVGVSPVAVDDASNDTGRVFNWHPLLMALAFPVLMGEALLAYRAPPSSGMDRPQRKTLHWALHTGAVACMVLGIVAAWRSHTLKKPAPIPNLYSVHSYLGVATASLALLQYLAGLVAYLKPKLPLPQRRALSPVHAYVGRCTFMLGLATMAAGLQEKATFLQAFKKSPVYGADMALPAVTALLLALVAAGVGYVHSAPPPQGSGAAAMAALAASEEEERASLVGGGRA